jgi:hypothetical protein
MKKMPFFGMLALLALSGIFASCEGSECIRCTKILSDDESYEFCSTSRDERMEFQVDYIRQGFNCEQIEQP